MMYGYRNIIKSYSLLVILSVVIFGLAVCLIVINGISRNLNTTAAGLEKRMSELRLGETSHMLQDVDRVVSYYGFPELDRSGARTVVLSTLEKLRNMYGAKIISSVEEIGSSFSSEVEFRFIPGRPEDAVKLLEYLRNSISPIFLINEIRFENGKSGKFIFVRANVTQPYEGGRYAY